MQNRFLPFAFIILSVFSCCKPAEDSPEPSKYVGIKVPKHFPPPLIPADNPQSEAKIRLGRMLFYEKRISEDMMISCASCHKQEFAFGSDKPLDRKVHGGMTSRNSSVLFNLAFTKEFFWDGRTKTLESTCKDALIGEQNFNISFVKDRLLPEQQYKDAFQAAYNTTEPTVDMVEKALANFIRTMVSGGSKVDKGAAEGNPKKYLSVVESEGLDIFDGEDGDCFHCHGTPIGTPLMTDNLFHNNGIDSFSDYIQFTDKGLGGVAGAAQNQIGTFKTGSVRNLSYSKPFMHDGRFPHLDAVLQHYNSGLSKDPNRNKFFDPNMKKANQGGVQLSPAKLARLKAFLLALDDPEFIADTIFSNPFK